MTNFKHAPEATADKHAARRNAIIAAALECFLQYGFAKTSLDDIARRAGLSRPLLYLLFKNKEELFVETLRSLYLREIDNARLVLDLNLSNKEKLIRIYDELYLKPWTYIYKSPSGKEFIEQCHKFFPQLDAEYEKAVLKLLLPIFADKETAQLFMLCVDGLYPDDPTPAVLGKRIRLLIERFSLD
ncbi:MAG TPA: helix-turn-helix domain-containing protein [Blastocatellia bacterium]|nr:helix-turn-helix domain-containing protein [Blastocatellia bacterium]